MNKFHTAIIGGGAAGIVAAISAKRKGDSVIILEKMPRLGKKLLVTGAGRCNLLNEDLDESYYNPEAKGIVKGVFARFGKGDIKDFFKGLGLLTYSEGPRVFPVTNQSSSVLKVLEIELKRLLVPLELDFEAVRISDRDDYFTITSKSGKDVICRALIIASGGKTYPALGSDGRSYKFAEQFGHKVVEPVPSAVPVVVKDAVVHLLQGQKIFAKAKCAIDGRPASEASGELLFTKYGLSGTAILDISEDVSIAINRLGKKNIEICVDMAPFIGKEQLEDEFEKRIGQGRSGEELLAGILPNKFGMAFKAVLAEKDIRKITKEVKEKNFKVLGTRSWNEAEFTSGGIDTGEVKESTLESKLKKGLYFAGEALDVNGKRGGYNLAWAWASGFVAGETE